ncbi:hypothetical protein NQ314_020407 [Rhamnusium bicolor]|uniref:Uncharacterized protein n=1 Tax=Rhamnusium bicolor TaxID=1586634 RepID=A0AAV8WKJ7_9CUCU|nr:hypothetical protein NQ314_020407 [Rhamnusium bicolor]
MKRKNKTVLSSKSGKVAVITGGTRGIGLEVIKMLLKCDITVVIGCRNTAQGEILLNILKNENITKGKIEVLKLDISIMDSVKQFSTTVKENYPKIHYLINNAGIMFGPYIETIDGYESQFSTNYLGHFLLTHFLLPQLKAAGEQQSMARIVNNAEQGAIPIVHACLSSKLEGKGGTYIHNCKVFPTSEMANSVELQKRLFDFTIKLLKINNFGMTQ